ncbi:hypothetical protein HanXRQr2_Chr12g0538251 [Helianthus annuus]|uniref:Uncharacterized protein n=1 Tax=Helianthus annuus TaxID=4232 RepID=A0A9K3HG24_HELAN|nr:hypothetical protein HanXRQr2_Chr12g0538251 [Helianthus annuus]KAJ0862428.1 hypothetical protein HanPSC8_Chr12g0518071 [Helianthus annuus]
MICEQINCVNTLHTFVKCVFYSVYIGTIYMLCSLLFVLSWCTFYKLMQMNE